MPGEILQRLTKAQQPIGLAGQLYDFQTDLQGRKAINQVLDSSHRRLRIHESIFDDPTNQDWRKIHSHPRIRFTGVYLHR
jgi:hypothetical protein